MKILTKQFRAQLAFAGSFIESSPKIPTLANILIDIKEGKMSLQGTNLSQHSKVSGISVDDDIEFSISTPYHKLCDILKNLPYDHVDIKHSGNSLEVRGGTSFFKIPALSGDNFPLWGSVNQHYERFDSSMSGKFLEDGLNSVNHATSDDQTRGILCGVNAIFSPDQTIFQATDGRRAVTHRASAQNGEGTNKSIIIPKNSSLSIASNFRGMSIEKVDISLFRTEESGLFKSATFQANPKDKEETYSISTKLVEGSFPDLKRVWVSTEGRDEIVVNAEEFSADVRRAASVNRNIAFARDVVSLEKPTDRDVLILKAENNSGNRSEVEHSAVLIDSHKGFSVCFNPEYMVQSMRSSVGKDVSIFLGDAISPILVKCGDTEELIMPIRTD